MNNTFFMVYLEGGGAPTYQHTSMESAQLEAQRLSEQFGKPTYVLMAVMKVELNKFKVTQLVSNDDLPF